MLAVASASASSLAPAPSNLTFGDVQVGSKRSQYEVLSNTGNSTVTLSQVTATGAGFTVNGLTLPMTLSRGHSVTFAVLFTPKTSGRATGAISVLSNNSNSSPTIAVSGNGISAGKLTSSATALNFGSVTVGSSKTPDSHSDRDRVKRHGFVGEHHQFGVQSGGISFPKTISAGQTVSFSLTFAPRASGRASGSISLASNAAQTPTIETLTGSGTATTQHSVGLSWTASASSVVGYNMYRSATSGGPYAKLTPALDASTNYVDSSVQGGKTYDYVSTAVDSQGAESKYSNQQQAVIPSP